MPPKLEDALERILTAAHNAGKKCGIYCKDGEQAKHFANQGYDMVTAVTDYTALQRVANEEVGIAKGAAKPKGVF